MSEVDRMCERCNKTTKHAVQSFFVPKRGPTATQRVDLTGRTGIPVALGPGAPLPGTVRYTCKACGYVSVIVGEDKSAGAGASAFGSLERGDDWKEPPK